MYKYKKKIVYQLIIRRKHYNVFCCRYIENDNNIINRESTRGRCDISNISP